MFGAESVETAAIKNKAVTAAKMATPWKAPVAVATTAAFSEVEVKGEEIESKLLVVLSVDGVSPTVGQRVLVKNEAEAKNDGIYEVVRTGKATKESWLIKRTVDANTTSELQDAVIVVEKGTANGGSEWTQTATVTTVGTTAQTWVGKVSPVTTVAIAYRKAGQKIPSGATTRVKIDTVVKDPGKNINVAEGFYEVPVEGYYSVVGNVFYAAQLGTGGHSNTGLVLLNGTQASLGNQTYSAQIAGGNIGFSVECILFCKAKDKIELAIYQDNAAASEAPTAENNESFNRLQVVRVA
jgi:hypothetical protein